MLNHSHYIDLTQRHANRVLNVVNVKYCLKNKAEAIELVIGKYLEQEQDPELLPEFIRKILAAEKGMFIKVDDFGKYFGLSDDVRPRDTARR